MGEKGKKKIMPATPFCPVTIAEISRKGRFRAFKTGMGGKPVKKKTPEIKGHESTFLFGEPYRLKEKKKQIIQPSP